MSIGYLSVREQIADGDLLLFRWPKCAIARKTGGPYAHAALAVWRGDCLALAEARGFLGARVVTLSSQVRLLPGVIDVFRAKCPIPIAREAANLAFRQAGEPYGWRDVCSYSLGNLLGRRCRAKVDPPFRSPKYCSEMAGWSFRHAQRGATPVFDPAPGIATPCVTPNDLSRGPFELLFAGLTP